MCFSPKTERRIQILYSFFSFGKRYILWSRLRERKRTKKQQDMEYRGKCPLDPVSLTTQKHKNEKKTRRPCFISREINLFCATRSISHTHTEQSTKNFLMKTLSLVSGLIPDRVTATKNKGKLSRLRFPKTTKKAK